jgi:spermidine synthase
VKTWQVLDRAYTPDGTELTLNRHPSELAILADGEILMSSRMHGSEDALATLGCYRAKALDAPRVLVGGLGMGFTLRAALDCLPSSASVIVAELVPAVVEWNRGVLGDLAGHPLDDRRVVVEHCDVAVTLRRGAGQFDAVLLDVDNGAISLTTASNDRLYDRHGVAAAKAALTPDGVLAVWSAGNERLFERRLRADGFRVERKSVRARQKLGGPRHTILIATNVS